MKQDILNSNLQDVTVVGEIQSHKAEIDAEDLGWILQILSSNLYSDPIGSLVREYSSNAWDANVESGNKDKPIEVGIQTDKDQGSYWYVTDLGPGISPERIEKVYRKFGKSTKRESNEAIGMMGLGKFAGLSYTDQIYITTRHNGMQYQYIMHKADGLPQIDMLGISPSDLPSGTTIKVFINGWSDKRDFIRATKQQLCFFENVYFNIDEEAQMNNYKMIKGKSFTYSELSDRPLRIKLGPVSYPLDWSKLDSNVSAKYRNGSEGYQDLALNFSIGELAITPNRESILYNKKTVENVQKRLEEFDKEIVALYDAKNTEVEDLEDFVKMLKNKCVKIGNEMYYLTPSQSAQVTKPVRLKGFPYHLNVSDWRDILSDYVGYATIQGGKKSKQAKDENGNTRYSMLNHSFLDTLNGEYTNTKVLLMETHTLDPKRTKFMCETHSTNDWMCIKRIGTPLFSKKSVYRYDDQHSYYFILGLANVPRAKWRERIKAFQEFQRNFIMSRQVLKYDDMNPTKDWLAAQRALVPNSGSGINALRKSNGKILVKVAVTPAVYNATASFQNKDMKLSELPNIRKWIVYGTEDDKELLAQMHTFGYYHEGVKMETLMVAKTHHKYFAPLTNFIEINELLKGKCKLFAKLSTLAFVYNEVSPYYRWFGNNKLLSILDPAASEIVDKIIKLQCGMYKTLNAQHGFKKAAALHQVMIDKAKETNMWDFELLALLSKFNKILDDYEFLQFIRTAGSNRDYSSNGGSVYYNTFGPETVKFTIDTAKRRKIRLALTHYQTPQIIEKSDESEEPC